MSEVIPGQSTTSETLRLLYAPIREEMAAVEAMLHRELSCENPKVDRLVKDGFRLGGKRLRPALVMLSAKAVGRLRPEHLSLAASVELIHTATLVHDDVLDEAILRRHLDTVNARWDNEASILLGDYLLARAVCLAASVDDPIACREIGHASKIMCEGELRQILGRGTYDLTEEEYLGIIFGKTAEFCACCCRLGAHYAGADEDLKQAASRYGANLGMAFQIVDDLLDMTGDEATTGKSLGTDLLKQKTTLPLIRLLNTVERADRQRVLSMLADSETQTRETLRPWFDRTDALGYTRGKADEYVNLAIEELSTLPESPIRDVLARLARFVTTRRN